MLLTRECDYGVRILRALSGGDLVNVADISSAEDISTQITYKLARKLDKAGMIESVRGVNGGYRLRRNLNEITLLDVFRAVDQTMMISECSCGNGKECSRNTGEHPCMVHKEFCRLQRMMQQELSAKSLADVIAGK